MSHDAQPTFTARCVHEQFVRIAPYYAQAYGLDAPIPRALEEDAVRRWRRSGQRCFLSAIVSVIETLDSWRESIDALDEQPVTIPFPPHATAANRQKAA